MTYKTTYTCDGCKKEIVGGWNSRKLILTDDSEVEKDRQYHFHSFACLKRFMMRGGK